MTRKPGCRPGDLILDRYVPHLSANEREVARARLRAWMRWTLKIVMRQVREMQHSDSRDGAVDGRMESAFSPPP